MDKPLWLLDVDGVLNAVNIIEDLQALEGDINWPDYQVGRALSGRPAGHTYKIIWSPTLVKRITALVEEDLVEIQWLTTWEERAQTQIGPLLGLPHFELPGKRDLGAEHQSLITGAGDYWWKFPLAREAVAETPQRPLIWTDDDLVSVPEATAWARKRWQDGGGMAMLVNPAWEIGLSPRQMDAIEAFCRGDLEAAKAKR